MMLRERMRGERSLRRKGDMWGNAAAFVGKGEEEEEVEEELCACACAVNLL